MKELKQEIEALVFGQLNSNDLRAIETKEINFEFAMALNGASAASLLLAVRVATEPNIARQSPTLNYQLTR